jgi:glutamine synthetase
MEKTVNHHYALANPISQVVDKPSADFTLKDMLKVVEEKQIEKITFHYTALDGKFKELKLPLPNRSRAERILVHGERVDGSSLFKGMVDPGLSDLYVVPVYRTAFLNPFDDGSLDFICRYLTKDGEPAPFALDTVLHQAYKLFRENTGYELHALGELEFFLLSEPGTNTYPAPKQGNYHSAAPFLKSGHILDEMIRTITKITGNIKYAHSEVGYIEAVRSDLEEIKGKRAEQLEIEFLPAPITDAGDMMMIARWLIRNVAYRYGCVATFTPKIEEGIAGNGLHIHLMLRKNNENVMSDENGNLTTEAKKIVGGLCTYADSLTAFGNTVSSAYFRLVPSQEAPTRICWSDLNRSVMIRVPLGWSKFKILVNVLDDQQEALPQQSENLQTVELRSPDGSALVYLLLAGITMAAWWGLDHEESLETAKELYVTGNIFQNERLLTELPALPKSCVGSSRVLLEKRKYYEREGVFPASIIEYIAKSLQAEKDEDLNQFLNSLPEDDRLREMRKLMHKDLHRH